MADDSKTSGSESNIQSTAQAVAALAEAIPVYEDALQPAARELGQGMGSALSILMAPLKMLGFVINFGVEEFKKSYEEKASRIPAENLVTPPLAIAGPVLQALTWTSQVEDLREMYVKLLASASDNRTASKAHPAYVEIIKQLSPEDAIFLRSFPRNRSASISILEVRINFLNGSGKTVHKIVLPLNTRETLDDKVTSVENFVRLGLLEIDFQRSSTDQTTYESMLSDIDQVYPGVQLVRILGPVPKIEREGQASAQAGILTMTEFGINFMDICVPA